MRTPLLYLFVALLLSILWGCNEPPPTLLNDDDSADDDDSASEEPTDPPPAPIVTSWSFAASEESFDNPERGFYRTTSLIGPVWFYEGYTLSFSYVRLDDYRQQAIPESFLDSIESGLQAARDAGVKIIIRFSYNWGPWPDSDPDAPLSWVLSHIEQLTPLLVANADVLAVVQAGFIGAWGEWHSSTNNLLDSKAEIATALLDAVPADRMLQLRTPMHKNDIFGNVPFPPADAHSGLDHARFGHHNDCFLASDADWGTYPPDAIEQWKSAVAAETLYTPMGGETCNLNPPRSECAVALMEFERFHYSYINAEYHPDVVASWDSGGCRETIEQRLGYRLIVASAEVLAGESTQATITIENVGWAAPFNPRTVWLVVDNNLEDAVALTSDPRSWLASSTIQIAASLGALTPGMHTLSLWLPDSSGSLAGDPRYSIRLAHDGMWDPSTGLNHLGAFEVPAR